MIFTQEGEKEFFEKVCREADQLAAVTAERDQLKETLGAMDEIRRKDNADLLELSAERDALAQRNEQITKEHRHLVELWNEVGELLQKPGESDYYDHASFVRALVQQVKEAEEKHERDMLKVIDEREAEAEALSQAYFLVTGESPEWSNLFGHEQALDEIAGVVNLLKSQVSATRATAAEATAMVEKASLLILSLVPVVQELSEIRFEKVRPHEAANALSRARVSLDHVLSEGEHIVSPGTALDKVHKSLKETIETLGFYEGSQKRPTEKSEECVLINYQDFLRVLNSNREAAITIGTKLE